MDFKIVNDVLIDNTDGVRLNKGKEYYNDGYVQEVKYTNANRTLEIQSQVASANINMMYSPSITIDLNKNYNFDLFGYYRNNNYLSVQVFFVRDGILFGHHTNIFTIVDDKEEAIIEYIIKFYENGNMDFMGFVSGSYEVSGNEVILKAYGETLHLQIDGDNLLDISEFSADGYSIDESSIVIECVEPDGKNHTFKAVEVLSKVN